MPCSTTGGTCSKCGADTNAFKTENGFVCHQCAHRARLELPHWGAPHLSVAFSSPSPWPKSDSVIAHSLRAGTGGKYKAGFNAATYCSNCAAGEYSGAGAGSCTDCDAGKYSKQVEVFQFLGIIVYRGASSCTDCDPGEYSNSGSSSCADCAAGKYSNPAKPGSTSLERGEGQCEPCAAGTFSGARASSCTDCAAGKYSSNGADKSGSISCTYCAPGEYSGARASSCTDCDAGKYSVGVMGTSLLEKGQGDCARCASGKYSPNEGRSSCLDCAQGTWSAWSTEGTSACTPCEGCAAGTTRGGSQLRLGPSRDPIGAAPCHF